MTIIKTWLAIIIHLIIILQIETNQPIRSANLKECKEEKTSSGKVCICSEDHCDTLDDVEPPPASSGRFLIIYSDINNRFKKIQSAFAEIDDTSGKLKPKVKIDRQIKHQTMSGFGAHLTGAASYTLEKLPSELREHIYTAYFSKTQGIGFNFVLVPIGGTAYDRTEWAYATKRSDAAHLEHFQTLSSEDTLKVAQIKEITKKYDVKLVGSAWTPPPWMKTNNEWYGEGYLLEKYYQTWADYHLKFLELMNEAGLRFWAVTTGYSASTEQKSGRCPNLRWESITQGRWIVEHLRPTLNKFAHKVNIFAGDKHWLQMGEYTQNIGTLAHDNMDGLAIHSSAATVTDHRILQEIQEMYSQGPIINTNYFDRNVMDGDVGINFGSWDPADRLIISYLLLLKQSITARIDMNLVWNDQDATANKFISGFSNAPIIVRSHRDSDGDLTPFAYKQPLFYAIGHFSRFIVDGSQRIDVSSDHVDLHVIGFERPDKSIVIILYNASNELLKPIIRDPTKGQLSVALIRKMIVTLVYKTE